MNLEVEAKLDVPTDFAVPELAGVVAGATVERPPPLLLDAQYWDAADGRLAAAGITVRYRTGEDPVGRWTVKFPSAVATEGALARKEHDLAGPAGSPPDEVQALLATALAGEPLVPAARLTTTRHRLLLRRGDGLAAEVADDLVEVDGGAARFRELEVELGPAGDARVLAALVAALRAAGAGAADPTPKLVRALRLLGR